MFPSPASGAARSWIVATLFALLLAVPSVASDTESAAPAEEASAAPSLARIAICEIVQERTPVGESDRFASDIGRLWCFTQVVGAGEPTRIFHRWYVGDQLVQEIPMTVKGESWRCWSNKGIMDSWSGPCRVEILTEAGDVIGTKEFQLTESAKDDAGSSES